MSTRYKTQLTLLADILPDALDQLLSPDETRQERVKRALAECKREHPKQCKNPVEALGSVQDRSEKARRRASVAEDSKPATPAARKTLWDTWARVYREATELGLTPQPLRHDAPDEEIRKAGSALWTQCCEVRKRQKGD